MVNYKTLELVAQHNDGLLLVWGAVMPGDMKGGGIHSMQTIHRWPTRLIAWSSIVLLRYTHSEWGHILTLGYHSYHCYAEDNHLIFFSSFLPQTHFSMSRCGSSSPEPKSHQDRDDIPRDDKILWFPRTTLWSYHLIMHTTMKYFLTTSYHSLILPTWVRCTLL